MSFYLSLIICSQNIPGGNTVIKYRNLFTVLCIFYQEASLNSGTNNLFDYVLLTENLSETPESTNPVAGSLPL